MAATEILLVNGEGVEGEIEGTTAGTHETEVVLETATAKVKGRGLTQGPRETENGTGRTEGTEMGAEVTEDEVIRETETPRAVVTTHELSKQARKEIVSPSCTEYTAAKSPTFWTSAASSNSTISSGRRALCTSRRSNRDWCETLARP